jgi:hypothetical protein
VWVVLVGVVVPWCFQGRNRRTCCVFVDAWEVEGLLPNPRVEGVVEGQRLFSRLV